MGLELNIRATELARALTVSARRRLRTMCVPPSGDRYVDRLEAAAADAVVTTGTDRNGAGSIVVHLPVDVFVVDRAALLAAPNRVPVGTTPAGRITLAWDVRAEAPVGAHPSLSVTARDPDLGALAALPGADAVRAGLADATALAPVDLRAVFTAMRADEPTAADTALVDGVAVFRFDPAAPPRARLAPGQGWGLFAAGSDWETLARRVLHPFVADLAGTSIPGADTPLGIEFARWHPDGTRPRTDVRVGTKFSYQLGISIPVHAWVDFQCEPQVFPPKPWGPPDRLRVTASWSFHLLAGPGIGILEHEIEKRVEEAIQRRVDALSVSAGPRQLAVDIPLPQIGFDGHQLRVDELSARSEGATTGGRLLPAVIADPAFGFDVAPLSVPMRIQVGCDRHDTSPLTLTNTSTFGEVTLKGAGRLCGYTVVSPTSRTAEVAEHLSAAADPHDPERVTVRAELRYDRAVQLLTSPLRLLVRTARGVRFVDLGTPPAPVLDPEGRLLNAIDLDLGVCNYLDPRLKPDQVTVESLKPIPVDGPDWAELVTASTRLVVQLVELNRLEPGELVQVRTPTHTVDVSADPLGRAAVPVIAPVDGATVPITFERATRRPLAGHVSVSTVEIGAGAAVRGNGSRRTSFRGAGETSLNPQPLPPGPPEVREQLGRDDVVDVLPVPGFESAPLAIAVLADGSTLVLDVRGDGRMRVAGTLRGPIGRIDAANPSNTAAPTT